MNATIHQLKDALPGYKQVWAPLNLSLTPCLTPLFAQAVKFAQTNASVLILGETGVGKSELAQFIHTHSKRSDGPFRDTNMTVIPEATAESELFGHKRGAFTGADRERTGLLESAQDGTAFLDEIGDTPMALQVKLLRALNDKKIRPLGSNTDIPLNIRFIAATHANLEDMVKTGKFREDLYHRISRAVLTVPPLREREQDIPHLAKHLLSKAITEDNLEPTDLSHDAIELLLGYPFPGNIRELSNIMFRAAINADGEIIKPEHLGLPLHTKARPYRAAPSGLDTDSKRAKMVSTLVDTGNFPAIDALCDDIKKHLFFLALNTTRSKQHTENSGYSLTHASKFTHASISAFASAGKYLFKLPDVKLSTLVGRLSLWKNEEYNKNPAARKIAEAIIANSEHAAEKKNLFVEIEDDLKSAAKLELLKKSLQENNFQITLTSEKLGIGRKYIHTMLERSPALKLWFEHHTDLQKQGLDIAPV